MCENLDVDLEAIACVHSLQYSTVQYIFQRDLKKIKKDDWYDHQSVQSGAGKLSRNKVALKRQHRTSLKEVARLSNLP